MIIRVMPKHILGSILLLLGALGAYAQSMPTVNIVNNTGYTIFYLFISPSESDYWGEDVLAADEVILDGETFIYQLTAPLNRVSVYDIRLIDEEGDDYIKWEVTLTNNNRIVFTLGDLEWEEDWDI